MYLIIIVADNFYFPKTDKMKIVGHAATVVGQAAVCSRPWLSAAIVLTAATYFGRFPNCPFHFVRSFVRSFGVFCAQPRILSASDSEGEEGPQ